MNPEVRKFLENIIDSIGKIEYHLKDIKSINDFSANITVSDAVKRRLGDNW
jgi:uncharacterized protein with HEPN domain